MATILSPSSPSPHSDEDHIPTATLALPSIAASSRRLPPPCWSADETVALIDAYKDKWYSLRRGNLRANHWKEVADDLALRCPASTPKTAVQCRHKMEKLRKRYRAEIQRAAAHGVVRRFASSWVHFQNMHFMEKGPNPSPPSSDDEEEDYKDGIKRINDSYNEHQKANFNNHRLDYNGAMNGFRIKIPNRVAAGPSAVKEYSNFDEISGQYPNNPNPNFPNYATDRHVAASNKVFKEAFVGRGEMGKRAGEISRKSNVDGVGEVAAAIHALGEGFMRVEKAKMDMVKQVEEMRMEMELKRTEMILESQKKIVEAFAKAMSERSSKRVKGNSTPPHC